MFKNRILNSNIPAKELNVNEIHWANNPQQKTKQNNNQSHYDKKIISILLKALI